MRQPERNHSLTPLSEHFVSALCGSFAKFNCRRDMWIGALFEASAIFFQWWLALLEDPLWVALTYILPIFSLLLGDAIWRTVRALLRIYKERPHIGFREYLFEMIGLYPAAGAQEAPQEDSLAKTLLRHLGISEEEIGICKSRDSAPEPLMSGGDAVK